MQFRLQKQITIFSFHGSMECGEEAADSFTCFTSGCPPSQKIQCSDLEWIFTGIDAIVLILRKTARSYPLQNRWVLFNPNTFCPNSRLIRMCSYLSCVKLITSLPLKKAQSSIYWSSSDFASNRTFALVSPHGCHPLPAINQVRTKVNPPWKVPPPWCATNPMESATPLIAVVYGDGGSKVHWPLGPNLLLRIKCHACSDHATGKWYSCFDHAMQAAPSTLTSVLVFAEMSPGKKRLARSIPNSFIVIVQKR